MSTSNKSPDATAQRHKPFVKGNTTATMKLCALLLCTFCHWARRQCRGRAKTCKPFVCQHVNHNTPGNCVMSNLGPSCDYCYEKAEIPQVSPPGVNAGTGCNTGYVQARGTRFCHDPWFNEPNKLRLAFWHKPGTICASLPVNVPCPNNGTYQPQ